MLQFRNISPTKWTSQNNEKCIAKNKNTLICVQVNLINIVSFSV